MTYDKNCENCMDNKKLKKYTYVRKFPKIIF